MSHDRNTGNLHTFARQDLAPGTRLEAGFVKDLAALCSIQSFSLYGYMPRGCPACCHEWEHQDIKYERPDPWQGA